MKNGLSLVQIIVLALKEPVSTAADDKFSDVFPSFRKK